MKPFSYQEVLRQSWHLLVNRWGVMLGSLAVMLVLNLAFGYATEEVGESSMGGLVITVFSIMVSIVLQLGVYRIVLNLVRGKEVAIDQLFSEYALGLRYFGASLVYFLIVVVGLILFIVPGVIFAIKYGYYGYAIVDRNLGVREALKLSAEITRGVKWQLLGFYCVLGLVFLVSAIPFGLGLIVTIPVSMIAGGVIYEKLLNAKEPSAPGEPAVQEPPADSGQAPFVPLQ